MLETLIEYRPVLEGLWTYLVISNTIFLGVIVLLFILGRLQQDIETYYTVADMRPKLTGAAAMKPDINPTKDPHERLIKHYTRGEL